MTDQAHHSDPSTEHWLTAISLRWSSDARPSTIRRSCEKLDPSPSATGTGPVFSAVTSPAENDAITAEAENFRFVLESLSLRVWDGELVHRLAA